MAEKPRYPLAHLEIVAYEDPPPPYLLPSIVAPIFRQRQAPHDLILPPYELEGDEVVGGALDAEGALKKMVWLKAAFRLPQPIEPQPDHVLWLDRGYRLAYEPRPQVLAHLKQHATDSIEEAIDALRERRYQKALDLAQTALAADEDCYGAVIVKAVVYTVQQKPTFVNELRHLARAVGPNRDFDMAVQMMSLLVPKASSATPGKPGWITDWARLDGPLSKGGILAPAALARA